jgi:regulator of PEP synthase PpsR (kinase-PPPase family)
MNRGPEKTLSRAVFFVSDGTGITAETLGRSLLSQFDMIKFDCVTIPYVDNYEKAKETRMRINEAYNKNGERPIIFTTFVNPEISQYLNHREALIIDFFQIFINPLEEELGHPSSHKVGLLHGVKNDRDYMGRINAVNYALTYDDGIKAGDYDDADVILLGVSRSGKTPTCLYLALQFGIFAANYPLTTDDMDKGIFTLPASLKNYHDKLFGLTIDPFRLQKIRQERFPNKDYAKLSQCQAEIKYAEFLFENEHIAHIDTTSRSIEEIAAEIMRTTEIKRK